MCSAPKPRKQPVPVTPEPPVLQVSSTARKRRRALGGAPEGRSALRIDLNVQPGASGLAIPSPAPKQ